MNNKDKDGKFLIKHSSINIETIKKALSDKVVVNEIKQKIDVINENIKQNRGALLSLDNFFLHPVDYSALSIEHLKGDMNKHVVIIHGITASIEPYKAIAKQLNEAHYDVHLIDLPFHGKGGSVKLDTTKLILFDWANMVANYIYDQDLENVTMFGHSMGAGMSILIAYLLRDRVINMILEDPLNPGLLGTFIKTWAFPLDDVSNEKIVEQYKKATKFMVDKRGEVNFVHLLLLKNITSHNTLDKMNKVMDLLSLPTLLIMGDDDRIVSASATRSYFNSKHLKISYKTVPESGHAPHISNPKIFNQMVLEFLINQR